MKNVLKNFFSAFGAQLVYLAASLCVYFVLPNLIGEAQFGYWQLFLTLVTYVNISRLGVMDGNYLRLGGKKYEELDFDLLSKQRRCFVIFQFFVSIIFLAVVFALNLEKERTFVLIACSICVVLINANNFIGYILQAVNLARKSSFSFLLQNVAWLVGLFVVVVFKIYDFRVMVIFYILGHLAGGIYLAFQMKEIYRFSTVRLSEVFKDLKESIRCGIKLMISLYAGTLVLASARVIVDGGFGIVIFGFFSFSLTLANLLLSFINQVSTVVFPALQTVPREKQGDVYYILRNGLSFILPIMMLGYFPITLIVGWILPTYTNSLLFLPIFLPICTFDGKMQMLCTPFFKSFRKETMLMIINVVTLAITIAISSIGAFVLNDIKFISYSLLIIVALRSIVSELILAHLMKTHIYLELAQEIFIVVAFVVGSAFFSALWMFIGYFVMYALYLLINIKRIKKAVLLTKAIGKKQNAEPSKA